MTPFAAFDAEQRTLTPLRRAVATHVRMAEADCIATLLPQARLAPEQASQARDLARGLVTRLRAKGSRGGVDGLIREYDLSSQEGVALMCLAEALLRIPDIPTRDALIRDKIGGGDWQSHLGHSSSLFVNAATWGLMVTGKLTGTASETGLSAALTRLIGRGGEPLIRRGVDMAMRMMGEQFVTGETIEEALRHARRLEARGFRHSYDMLGEAAATAEDAARYFADYQNAIHAIGRASNRRGIVDGPGISVKLSALHPRYSFAQHERVMTELLPRLIELLLLARQYDIGLNIDAEEADRLEPSLDLLEAACLDPRLAGWNGIGFVVQAYQKRAPFVLDFCIDLARRTDRRLMIRLVKGAYWDSEIKRAQLDGLDGFPVFTRKRHTDISYLACARKLLAAPDAVFPQFATHNAQTLAAIHTLAGPDFTPGQYEFQCLHGMGEPLYDEVVGADKLDRPCRIYAPVGTHATLLAYLVRRLLENGANSSFVNRIADPAVAIDDLVADPIADPDVGTPHAGLRLPRDLFAPDRENSAGLDLADPLTIAQLAAGLSRDVVGDGVREVRNPADRRDLIGHVTWADEAAITAAIAGAAAPVDAAASLRRAATLMEVRQPALIGLLVREAGKSFANAVAEIREAVDFLRYYAQSPKAGMPRGPVLCISPWNFPLAIFTGQIAAALAAGNPVLAKPAEETPLIAAAAVAILHEAGISAAALQLLQGAGEVGARLVADPAIQAVMFTGSTDVARLIQRQVAERLDAAGGPVALIAETGGQNALIVDSSALAEQVVADVLLSAFDSAGQRCSALRVLCLQDEAADRVLGMLKGAVAELSVGNPDRLANDIGPVITAEAAAALSAHVDAMAAAGHAVHRRPLPERCAHGNFIAPTIIEIDRLSNLTQEVFGPILHVLRYRRDGLDNLLADINATGFGLTFGVHTRIDETIARATTGSDAGNIYVNRNLIGAVVGVQPFGGHGLSGTGPKAGGPIYVRRLTRDPPPLGGGAEPQLAKRWRVWLAAQGHGTEDVDAMLAGSLCGLKLELPGPVGERDLYRIEARGTVHCDARTDEALLRQIGAALATGNRVTVPAGCLSVPDWVLSPDTRADAILTDARGDTLIVLARETAALDGPIVQIHRLDGIPGPGDAAALEGLVRERSVSINTTAAGGNASLMTLA